MARPSLSAAGKETEAGEGPRNDGRFMRLLCHDTRRTGVHRASVGGGRRYRSERGFSLIELVMTFAVITVVLAIALPRMPRQAFVLWGVQEQLLGDLRGARGDALTKGDHFRVDITGASTSTVSRMQLNGAGAWVPRTPPLKTRELPPGITFTTGTGLSFEFNTRGLMVNPSWAATLFLYDATHNLTRVVTVWPSGQVSPG